MEVIRRGRDIILNPKVHKRTLIWLHGLGDSAEGFLPLFQMNNLVEDCRIVLLTAPVRPVTLNYGVSMNSWYDITSIGKREMNQQVLESAEVVSEEIESQKKDVSNLLLGGFSQGGALSLYTAYAHIKNPIAGVIGISSYAMNYLVKENLKNTPLFLYHGKNDEMVTLEMASSSYQNTLKNVKFELMTESGLGHGVSLRALNELKNWVKKLKY